MMRAETGVNQRHLLCFWIVDGELAPAILQWKQLRRGIAGPFFAEGRVVARTNSRSEPNTPLLVEHRIVHDRLAAPDGFFSPVGRGRRYLVLSRRRGPWIADRHLYLTPRVPHRVEDGQIIRAELCQI